MSIKDLGGLLAILLCALTALASLLSVVIALPYIVSSPSLSINAGNSAVATLTVTLGSGNQDISVTAMGTSASANSTAIAIVRGVSVSISPSSQGGPNGTTLEYGVTITNTGNVDDTYSLTATDNAGWSPSIPTPFPIPAFTYGVITMSVTVPSDAAIGTIDNIVVTANGTGVSADNSCTAQVTIAKRVSLSISPVSENGLNGDNLSYTVTVKNTGNVPDNYSLTVTDNAGWSPNVSLTSLTLSPGNSENATLSLTIPSNAVGGAIDNINVKATSKTDNTVTAENRCTAKLRVVRGVNVSISPTFENGLNRDNKTFSVTVTNLGNVPDNYSLTTTDTDGWSPSVSPTSLVLLPGSSDNSTLKVTIPDNAPNGTEDNITVSARSQDNTTIDNDSCTVRAIAIQVRVSISPAENGALPGQSIRFIVSVMNIRDNADNYILHASDNLGWNISLADNSMENVLPGRIRITLLNVVIPDNAAPDTRDGITVTATSRDNENVTGIATCVARSIAIVRSVDVSIAPAGADGMPGSGLSFTIKVKNTGNIIDNYDLTFADNAGWNPSISDNSLEIQAGENLSVKLNIRIPDDALPGTSDNISVTVTSHENAAVRNSATCLVEALVLRRVEVTISPDYLTGPAGAMLDYTVMVTNTGKATDNYMLAVNGTSGWRASIVPSSLSLEPGQSGEATLTITVPPGASDNSMIFYVWAISSADQRVRNNATCRAIAVVLEEKAGLSIPWIQIILIAAIIIGAVFTVGYLTRRKGRRGGRSKVLRAVVGFLHW